MQHGAWDIETTETTISARLNWERFNEGIVGKMVALEEQGIREAVIEHLRSLGYTVIAPKQDVDAWPEHIHAPDTGVWAGCRRCSLEATQ